MPQAHNGNDEQYQAHNGKSSGRPRRRGPAYWQVWALLKLLKMLVWARRFALEQMDWWGAWVLLARWADRLKPGIERRLRRIERPGGAMD